MKPAQSHWSEHQWCLTSTETIMRIRPDGGGGGGGDGRGGRGRLYTYRYSHSLLSVTTRMTSRIKMGSDENHFNVSVAGSDGQSHRTVPTNHNLFQEKGEPKRYRGTEVLLLPANALPLGQTSSHGSQLTGLGYCVRGQGGSTRCFRGSERYESKVHYSLATYYLQF